MAASAIPYGKTGRLALQDGLFRIVKRPVSHGRMAGGLSPGGGGRYVALDGDTTIYRMEESSLTQILTLSETGL